jgi:hypothetical protein
VNLSHQASTSACIYEIQTVRQPDGCREQLSEALERIDVLGSTSAQARTESNVLKIDTRNQLAEADQRLRQEESSHSAAIEQSVLLNTLLEEVHCLPVAQGHSGSPLVVTISDLAVAILLRTRGVVGESKRPSRSGKG